MSVPLIIALTDFSFESENDLLLLPATFFFFVAGFMLRVWARKHIRSAEKNGCRLCTTGPYAMLRHPVYVGNILIFTGVTVSTEVIWLLPLTIIWGITVYSMAARAEERDLLKEYAGDYEDYQRRVRRWVPRIRLSFPKRLAPAGWAAAMAGELSMLLLFIPALIKELIS
jgi:protein-S-isoprenylcysteine O-methyltransferase Ste14